MKQKRIIYLIIFIWMGFQLHAQITIGSGDPPHPGAVLELKSNDKGFLGPRVQLQRISSPDPVINPAKGLLVFNIGDSGSGSEQVKKERFYSWSGTEWVEFVYEEAIEGEITQIMDDAGIPRSAIFHLNGTDIIDGGTQLGMLDAMKGLGLGEATKLIFKETYNMTNNNVTHAIAYDCSFLLFKKGVYSITFAYQFVPSKPYKTEYRYRENDCIASSYFVDFPLERNGITGDRARIHNVAYHEKGDYSQHGGSISYVVKIESDGTQWQVQFGAGQSGASCNYQPGHKAIPGFSLVNESTFLLVTRMGD